MYDMALEPEIRREKNQGEIISTNKWARIVISLSVGLMAGLLLFFIINALSVQPSLIPASSPPTAPSALPATSESGTEPEPVDVVALCKAGVIKYTPLGAYPGGSDQVKAALTYCNRLG